MVLAKTTLGSLPFGRLPIFFALFLENSTVCATGHPPVEVARRLLKWRQNELLDLIARSIRCQLVHPGESFHDFRPKV